MWWAYCRYCLLKEHVIKQDLYINFPCYPQPKASTAIHGHPCTHGGICHNPRHQFATSINIIFFTNIITTFGKYHHNYQHPSTIRCICVYTHISFSGTWHYPEPTWSWGIFKAECLMRVWKIYQENINLPMKSGEISPTWAKVVSRLCPLGSAAWGEPKMMVNSWAKYRRSRWIHEERISTYWGFLKYPRMGVHPVLIHF